MDIRTEFDVRYNINCEHNCPLWINMLSTYLLRGDKGRQLGE